jgi:hypothetical protein
MNEFISRGRRYRFDGTEPYITKDGRAVTLTVLSTVCSDCGSEAKVKCLGAPVVENLNRRCDGCKKPGIRVGWLPKNRRKIGAKSAHEDFGKRTPGPCFAPFLGGDIYPPLIKIGAKSAQWPFTASFAGFKIGAKSAQIGAA